jgi:enoyl-CoA hydratase/carnithine racemase
MAGDLILSEREGGVLTLTLNAPEQMNAWSAALEDEYFAALDAAEADPGVRAVVLTGSGRAFCAGVGLADLDGLADGGLEVIERPRPRSRPYLFPKPLIAAINGGTAGLGLVEALYCDVRFCVPGAKLTTAFARRGLIAEYGIAWLLQRIVSGGRARDLLLSGRVLSGEAAAEIGLVDFLVAADELREASLAYAREIAGNCSPTSLAVMKEQLRNAADSDFDSAFAEAEPLLRASLSRPDFAEGVASFVERREPDFPPLSQP